MNDIYAYFDYQGTLKERVSAPVRADSTQVNSIYAYWDNQSVEPVTYSVTWRLVGSDSFETTSEHYAETIAIPANYLGRRDLVFFKEAKLYDFIRFPVPSAVTAVAGTYIATIRYALSTQATFVLGSLTFEVEGDRGIVLGESLTLDQYNYLLEQYSEVYDWATLRFLPLTGGTITGDLEVTGTTTLDYLNVSEIGAGSISSSGTIWTSGSMAAAEYRLSTPDETIIKLDNSVGDTGELQFGIPSGDYSPAFYGSLGVEMWDGREKTYPSVKFNYYDSNGDYESTTEEQIATQQWSDARYLKLTGGIVTGLLDVENAVIRSLEVGGPSSELRVLADATFLGDVSIPGDLNVTGANDFSNNIKISASAPTEAYHATRKDYVDNLVASVKANAFQVAQTLPQTGEEGVIYLVPVQGTNYYTQYIWEGNSWLDIGDTQIDLSGYLPLAGGTITGDLSIDGSVYLNGSDLETELSEKANKDSYYGTLGAGYADVAKELETSIGTEQETPFSFNTVGGKSDVSTGEHRLDALTGVSVVDNQQGDFTVDFGTKLVDGITIDTDLTNKTIRYHGTSTASNWAGCGGVSSANDKGNFIVGHIYYVKMLYAGTVPSSGVRFAFVAFGERYTPDFIATATSISQYMQTQIQNGTAVDFTILYRFYDLTQRYGNNSVVNAIIGSSNQVANLLRFDPDILKLTSYEPGTLVSSKTKELLSVGYNQWDEETELGYYSTSTGAFTSANNQLCSKNKTLVIGGMQYTLEKPSNTDVLFYDENENFISFIQNVTASTPFTTPVNCRYITINLKTSYGTTYNHDIAIHFTWDGSRTGYEPYETLSYQLPNIVQRGILKVDSDGNVYADGDVAYPDGTGETRFTLINLGDLNWYKGDANSQRFYASAPTLVGWVNNASAADINAIVSTGRYQAVILDNLNPTHYDNRYCVYINHYIYILDKEKYASMTAAEFKSAMNGIYLCAKLATPTPITFDPFAPNIYGDDFGTFQALDENGNEANLQGFSIFYRANIAGFAESIYAKTDGDPEKIVYEEELAPIAARIPECPTSTDGTYVLKCIVSNGVATYAWVAE